MAGEGEGDDSDFEDGDGGMYDESEDDEDEDDDDEAPALVAALEGVGLPSGIPKGQGKRIRKQPKAGVTI